MSTRTSNMLHMIAYATAILVSATILLVAQHAFGGGGGQTSGGCTSCNSPYSGQNLIANTPYRDVNGNGQRDRGDRFQGERSGGSDGGRGNSSPQTTTQTSQPRACTLTVNRPVIAIGTSTLALTWTPAPANSVSLMRSGIITGRLSVPNGAVSFVDTVAPTRTGPFMYYLSFGDGGSAGYACSVEVRVVTQITECNDGIDNGDDEDTLIDQQDPGCHTDGDPRKPTYDPTDMSESNTVSDMRPSLSISGAVAVGRTVQVTGSARNTGTSFAVTNDLVYGYRYVDNPPNYCKGSDGVCFSHSGKTFRRLDTYARSYSPGEQMGSTEDFTPVLAGNYELCAIADYDNDVYEGTAGEANNSTCRSIVVTNVPTNLSIINGPVTLDAKPERVRSGLTSTLTWNTGGRVACTLTGSNGESVPVTSMTGTVTTRAITAQTIYTLACTDADSVDQDQATIGILPRYQEI